MASTRKSAAGGQVRDAADQMQNELKEFARWFNDDVVPNVRRGSSKALRVASAKLTELAEQLERHTKTPKSS